MRRILVLGLLAMLLTGCGGFWSNRLPYAGPVEIAIPKGDHLPGTGIQYLGKTEEGAQVSIGGKQTTKRVGDSLEWKEDMVSGVSVDQTLRVAAITDQSLQTEGTVRVIVSQPRIQPESPNKDAFVHFKLPVGYHVRLNETIPGTTISYLGKTEDGAHLGNVEGAAYRKLGDSITWEAKLRRGIWLQLDLQTVLITESLLDVVGTADLWIVPAGE
ncbi:MAG: hypothetical protein PVG56_08720 [Anaerolineae bacterium]|jgi:hypothetical protein